MDLMHSRLVLHKEPILHITACNVSSSLDGQYQLPSRCEQCIQRVLLRLAGQHNVLPASRFPAVRRPQQLHNVALALNAMQKAGLSLQVRLVNCSLWSN